MTYSHCVTRVKRNSNKMPADSTQDEARRIAREAFLVFEHKEGSKLVDEKYGLTVKAPPAWPQAVTHLYCPCRDFPTIVRSMGINPTGGQIDKLLEQVAQHIGDSRS